MSNFGVGREERLAKRMGRAHDAFMSGYNSGKTLTCGRYDVSHRTCNGNVDPNICSCECHDYVRVKKDVRTGS